MKLLLVAITAFQMALAQDKKADAAPGDANLAILIGICAALFVLMIVIAWMICRRISLRKRRQSRRASKRASVARPPRQTSQMGLVSNQSGQQPTLVKMPSSSSGYTNEPTLSLNPRDRSSRAGSIMPPAPQLHKPTSPTMQRPNNPHVTLFRNDGPQSAALPAYLSPYENAPTTSNQQPATSVSNTNTTSSKTSHSDGGGKTHTSTNFSLNTLINTKHELSLPGFLELRDDFDYEYVKQLKSGGGGLVFTGKATTHELMERCDGKEIIIKKLHKIDAEYEKELKLIFDQEIAMMWFFNKNPYFATILGYCNEPKCIIMKFYPLGSLLDMIFNGRHKYSLFVVHNIMFDVTSALRSMHSSGFAHCDIKPDNILLEYRNNRLGALLTDFGITQIFDHKRLLVRAFQKANIEGGSLKYAAPEVIKLLRSTKDMPQPPPDLIKMRDVYSFAMVSYELVCKMNLNRMPKWQKAKK